MSVSIPSSTATQPAPRGFALWQLGFRPFYLLASTFGALSIALWGAQLGGLLDQAWLQGPVWHAHEMLFGFAAAVLVGFLLTAGRNWSNQPTPSGGPLAALAVLWLAGRVLVLTPWGWVAAVVNAAFPLMAAFALWRALHAGGNRRNYFFVGLLVAMGAAQFAVHLSQLGVFALPPWVGLQAALDIMLFVIAVMAGRVVPMFTNAGVKGAGASRHPQVEKIALGSVLALMLVDALQLAGLVAALVLFVALASHAVRFALWRPWRTLRKPIVWVLHAAYAFVLVHFALRAATALGWLDSPPATHALTLGAIGVLMIGMMTRTARGHTARPLVADRFDVACYLLVIAAALVRVGMPFVAPSMTVQAYLWSSILWSGGFGLYAVRYWPVLTRPRLDGKPG